MNKKKCFLPLGETFNLAEKSSSELHTQVSFVCLGRWMTSSNLARNSSQYTYYEMRISSAHLYKPRYWPIYSKATKVGTWHGLHTRSEMVENTNLPSLAPAPKELTSVALIQIKPKENIKKCLTGVITDSCNFKQNDFENFALYSREWKLTALMHFESDDTLAALSFKGKALRAATKKKRRWKRREAT